MSVTSALTGCSESSQAIVSEFPSARSCNPCDTVGLASQNRIVPLFLKAPLSEKYTKSCTILVAACASVFEIHSVRRLLHSALHQGLLEGLALHNPILRCFSLETSEQI